MSRDFPKHVRIPIRHTAVVFDFIKPTFTFKAVNGIMGPATERSNKVFHPLDPLTADDIHTTAAIIKARYADGSVHFKSISVVEPPKKILVPYLSAERAGVSGLPPLPRKTQAV